jgi:predicted nucleic acid-binding protein
MRKLVVDSCVLIAAVNPREGGHAEATQFFEVAAERGDMLFLPATALWDIGSALSHPGKRQKGSPLAKAFRANVLTVSIDEELFKRAWSAVIKAPVKGADRIVLSCAIDLNCPLVTSDNGILVNSSAFSVKAITPRQYVDEP